MKKAFVLPVLLAAGLAVEGAQAAFVLQPTTYTTDMGGAIYFKHVIDQSGLSTGYTSLVTDFDTYIAGNPTHESLGTTEWVSDNGSTTGYFDFDLGGTYAVESMAFWNYGGNNDSGVSQVSLLANGVTSLGTFSVSAFNSDPFAAVRPVVVTFAPTDASSIRVQIDSNLGDNDFTAFGEVAFEAAAVPEPSVLALLLGGLGGIRLYQRRKTHRA